MNLVEENTLLKSALKAICDLGANGVAEASSGDRGAEADKLRHVISQVGSLAKVSLIMTEAPKTRWRHVKSGGVYSVIGAGLAQSAAPMVDDTMVMIYQGADRRVWVRPTLEFADGRFVASVDPLDKPA